MPISVLIDESSASASEIRWRTQDNDRGLIIGSRSFGKGLQEEFDLAIDGALRPTVARFYTPMADYQKPYGETLTTHQTVY